MIWIAGKKIPKERWKKINKSKLGNLSGIVNFLRAVEETKLIIEPYLYNLVEKLKEEIKDRKIMKIIERAVHSPSWRERATMMKLLTEYFNKKFERGFVKAACAIELAQEAFMLRDDILDEQKRCVNRDTIPKLYGIKVSSLATDVMLCKARELMLEAVREAKLESKKAIACISLFEELLYFDALGQWMDLESENKLEVKEKGYFKMIELTPGTQFKNLFAIVCYLANKTDQNLIKNFQEFGKWLGMAAQLRDDIIDVIGDEEVVHKKLGTDVARGKKRLPLIKYLEENPQDKKLFSQEISKTEVERILAKIRETNIPYCINKVKELTAKALEHLNNLEEKEIKTLKETAKLIANFD